MKTENFDERQLQIRGEAYKHGFVAAMTVMLINAALYSFGIVWADGFRQNMLSAMFVLTIFATECHLRGAYYKKEMSKKTVAIVYSLLTFMLIFMNLFGLMDGKKLIADGTLTQEGGSTIIALMLFVSTVIIWVHAFREKKERQDN